MKRCPFCAEEIQDAAKLCRFCGKDLPVPSVPSPPTPIPSVATTTTAVLPNVAAAPRAKAPAILWKLGAATVAVGFVLTLFDGSIAIGLLLLFVGLCVTFWRPTYQAVGMLLLLLGSVSGMSILSIPGWNRYAARAAIADKVRETNKKEAAAQQYRAAEANARKLFDTMKQQMAGQEWRVALQTSTQIRTITRGKGVDGLPAAEEVVRDHVRRLDVADGIVFAQKVVADPKECDNLKAIGDAWARIRNVRASDAEWAGASAVVPKLEACRSKMQKEMSKGMREIMVTQREAWSKRADSAFLENGMNFTISLSGANKEYVTLKWALMSRAAIYKLTNGGSMAPDSFLGGLQKIGFKKVTFTDGFNESWSYTLDPTDESNGGVSVLAQSGLGQPLRLSR